MAELDSNNSEVTIDDNDDLWRRVSPKLIFYDENLKRYRPMSGTFKDKSLSVFIAKLVYQSGRTPQDLLQNRYENNGMVTFTAGFARALGQVVIFDPPKEGDSKKDPAHGLVLGVKNKIVQDSFATKCEWLVLPEEFR